MKWTIEIRGEVFEIDAVDVFDSMVSGAWFHPLSGARIYTFVLTGKAVA